MLPGGIIGALALVCGLLAPVQTQAQDQQPLEAPEVGWADGEAAFGWAQDWVRSEQGVPADEDLPRRAVTGVFGVYVTLRDEGRLLGQGQALRTDLAQTIDQPGPAVQLPALVAAATRQALADLRDTEMRRALDLNVDDPDLFQQGLAATRERAQLDIQVGYNLRSIVLPVDADQNAVFATFAPGFHGLRMAGPLTGDADYAWPGTELAYNTAPNVLVLRLLGDQGYDAEDLGLIARADGPTLQRFEVLHLVRPGPAQPMRRLTRGNLVLQQQVVDARTITGLAERTARYLDRLVVTAADNQTLVVRGTYQPTHRRFAPAIAQQRETALLTYALTRHAAIAIDSGIAERTMRARAERAMRLVEQLGPEAIPQPGRASHLTAAFLLLALCESPNPLVPDQLVLRDRLGMALLELRHPEGGGYRVAPEDDQRLSRASAAVITAALAAWYEQTRSPTLVEPVWAVLSDLMAANADDARVVDLLWVAIALDKAGQALADGHDPADEATDQLTQWRAALADQLDLLREQQVTGRPILGPEDVTGGFVLAEAIPGSPPNPTWRSAMPVHLLALAMRDPGIIPEDRVFGPLLSAGLGARFLGQLMITGPSTYYLRDAETALGGVRSTLFDNTLYPDCSSMTLLALAELQKTLHELEPADE